MYLQISPFHIDQLLKGLFVTVRIRQEKVSLGVVLRHAL